MTSLDLCGSQVATVIPKGTATYGEYTFDCKVRKLGATSAKALQVAGTVLLGAFISINWSLKS